MFLLLTVFISEKPVPRAGGITHLLQLLEGAGMPPVHIFTESPDVRRSQAQGLASKLEEDGTGEDDSLGYLKWCLSDDLA